jgi:hypothetical protein
MGKLSIYKYIRTGKGWRYCKAAFHPNGKIKPNVVVVEGREEKHPEGSYFLNFNRQWFTTQRSTWKAGASLVTLETCFALMNPSPKSFCLRLRAFGPVA